MNLIGLPVGAWLVFLFIVISGAELKPWAWMVWTPWLTFATIAPIAWHILRRKKS